MPKYLCKYLGSHKRGLLKMNEQEKDLEKAEQDFFNTLMSLMLYLNSNGMNLDGIKEMFDMKIRNAFEIYPRIKEKYDKEHKGEKWSWKE